MCSFYCETDEYMYKDVLLPATLLTKEYRPRLHSEARLTAKPHARPSTWSAPMERPTGATRSV